MADISKIKIGEEIYNINDETARETIEQNQEETAAELKKNKEYTNKTHYGYSGADILILPEGSGIAGASGEYEFTSAKCLVIPEGYTNIGGYSFDESDIEKIIFPSTITTIGLCAFYNCYRLEKLILPNTISAIGAQAFDFCPLKLIDLTSYIDEPFPEIDSGAFGFNYFEGLTIKVIKGRKAELNDMTNWSELYDYVVEVETPDTAVITAKNYTDKTHYGYSGDDLLIIPEGTTTISYNLYKNNQFKCVVIPQGVTTLDISAFGGCEKLISVTIPNSVALIDEAAFEYCYNLKTLDLTSFVTESFPMCGMDLFYPIEDYQIKVIKGRKSELSAMTNWSAYADYIVEVPTVETVDTELENKCDKLYRHKIEIGGETRDTYDITFNFMFYSEYITTTSVPITSIDAVLQLVDYNNTIPVTGSYSYVYDENTYIVTKVIFDSSGFSLTIYKDGVEESQYYYNDNFNLYVVDNVKEV